MLQIDFWDVGFGDAAVIWLDYGRVIIIDCGPCNSRLPIWIKKHGISVELVVLTHNDRDHFGGFLRLISTQGKKVGPFALVRDRSSDELKKTWKRLLEWRDLGKLGDPIQISPRRKQPQDLLKDGKVKHQLGSSFKLEAIYPNIFDTVQTPDEPNYKCALIVLWFNKHPIVAWPGDLPLKICSDELNRIGIKPTFLVGPHHGGPIDIDKLDIAKLQTILTSIGHTESWISVGWHEEYKHPKPNFIKPMAEENISIHCSQLTPNCDSMRERFGEGLIPTHDLLGLEKPAKGISCMGPMRVRFSKKSYKIRFAEEHRKARENIEHPLCIR